jgi:hypothetical protein
MAEVEADLLRAMVATRSDRRAALDRAQRTCQRAIADGSLYRAGQPDVFRAAGTCAWLRGKPDEARRFWQLSLDAARFLEAKFEVARTLLETGARLGDRSTVEEAEVLATSCGAELVRRRAQQVLARLAA